MFSILNVFSKIGSQAGLLVTWNQDMSECPSSWKARVIMNFSLLHFCPARASHSNGRSISVTSWGEPANSCLPIHSGPFMAHPKVKYTDRIQCEAHTAQWHKKYCFLKRQNLLSSRKLKELIHKLTNWCETVLKPFFSFHCTSVAYGIVTEVCKQVRRPSWYSCWPWRISYNLYFRLLD